MRDTRTTHHVGLRGGDGGLSGHRLLLGGGRRRLLTGYGLRLWWDRLLLTGGDLGLRHDLLVPRGDRRNVELHRGGRDGRLAGERRALADHSRDWRRGGTTGRT